MTRIIAGSLGGRRIETPKGDGTRPTSDRVREALFSSLESELGGFEDLVVLDLFAGSGALGLESASRGATSVVFVESDVRAAAAISRNVTSLDVPGRVVRSTAERFVAGAQGSAFDLVFLDPPYVLGTEVVADLVRRLAGSVAPDALFVVERSTRDVFAWPENIHGVRHKAYGETTLWYGR